MSSIDDWVGSVLAEADYFSEHELSDVEIATVRIFGEEWAVTVERVISIHLVHMRSDTVAPSWRALDQLAAQLQISIGPTRITGSPPESQTVLLSSLEGRPRRVFISHPRGSRTEVDERPTTAPNERLRTFVGTLANHLVDRPEEEWREAALAVLATAGEPKSEWADPLGPLYTSIGLACVLNMPNEQVQTMATTGALLALASAEGELLFPVAQVRRDGRVVRGLQWVLAQLDEQHVDRYTLAAWLNSPKTALEGRTVWEALGEGESVPDIVRDLVLEFRRSTAQ